MHMIGYNEVSQFPNFTAMTDDHGTWRGGAETFETPIVRRSRRTVCVDIVQRNDWNLMGTHAPTASGLFESGACV